MQEKENRSDEQLVFLARSGDARATEQLLNRYGGSVRACAREFFLLGGERDDLVQEGMVGLYLAIGAYQTDSDKSFKNFAYLCVRRRIIDAVKHAASKKKMPLNGYVSIYDPDLNLFSEEQTPEELLIGSESRREFYATLSKQLSDFEFKVISLYLSGMSYQEICDATGKNFKSVDNALARAKKKLERKYGV